jgi:hypothetical protein
LTHERTLGGLAEVLGVGERDEVTQVTQVHCD